jgi:hypothetical protein
MFNILKTAALSAFVGLGALSAIPAAHADGIYLNLGNGEVGGGMYVRDNDRWHRPDRWERPDRYDRWERACLPDRALDKADRMGIHRARVVDMGRRTISVAGRKWGDRVVVTFGREPHCPILR